MILEGKRSRDNGLHAAKQIPTRDGRDDGAHYGGSRRGRGRRCQQWKLARLRQLSTWMFLGAAQDHVGC
jgi:hypothetical protein